MPVIRLEVSGQVALPECMHTFWQGLHAQVLESIDTDAASVKSYLAICENFFVADGSKEHGFVMLHLKIMLGRSEEQKQRLGRAVLHYIQQQFNGLPANQQLRLQFRLNLTELCAHSYFCA